MPDTDDEDWTCKHLWEGECWRHFKPLRCGYETLVQKRKCKEFKEKMVW